MIMIKIFYIIIGQVYKNANYEGYSLIYTFYFYILGKFLKFSQTNKDADFKMFRIETMLLMSSFVLFKIKFKKARVIFMKREEILESIKKIEKISNELTQKKKM